MVQVPRELLDNLVTNSQLALMYGGCSQSDKISIRKDVDAAETILDAPQGQAGGWVSVEKMLPEPEKRVVFLRTWDGWEPEFRPKAEIGHVNENGAWILEAWGRYCPASEASVMTHWADLPEAVSNA